MTAHLNHCRRAHGSGRTAPVPGLSIVGTGPARSSTLGRGKRMASSTLFYTRYASPIGELILVGDTDRLTELLLPEHHGQPATVDDGWIEARAPFARTVAQLDAYFAGELTDFDLPLAPEGT